MVACGGHLDLAASVLGDVRAPSLLLVGAANTVVLRIHSWAATKLRCETRVEVVPRATHLFVEAGAPEFMAQRAGDWFCAHLHPPA